MKPYLSLFLLTCACLAGVAFADPTVSIFVKDASEFQAIQADLQQLKAGIGSDNPELDSLISQANRIAKMNNRCGMVSINDVLDEACGHFYAVELPEFEARYMEITGELRLGVMTMANDLEQRTQQIDACTEALSRIVSSKELLLKIEGGVDLEPLSHAGAFDASYNFKLRYDGRRMDQQKHFTELWLSKCGDIVLRKSGDEFAPLFVEAIGHMNDSLVHTKTNLKVELDTADLSFYLDLNRSVAGAYYLSGAELFSVTQIPTGKENAHLVVNMKDKSVVLPRGRDGEMASYKGRVEFEKASDDLVGRWIWNRDSTAIKAMPKMESKMVASQVESSEMFVPEPYAEPAAGDKVDNGLPEAKKSDGPHWVLIGISAAALVGGTVVAIFYNNKAKDESTKAPSSQEEFDNRHNDIGTYQTFRTTGIGIAILGGIGLGLSIAF
ncbi:MAG: hypothetical protein IKX42_04735 [Fibrobacter sp.]|nr:hypothetical protein [Fibrobacter sp.]